MKLATYHSTGMVAFQLTRAANSVFGMFFIHIFTLVKILPDDASVPALGHRGRFRQLTMFL